jgi:hypothetical protein
MSRRDLLLEWWPAIARYSGLGLGAYGVVAAPSQDKASILGFAGALILTPLVAGAQRKRNADRGIEDDE